MRDKPEDNSPNTEEGEWKNGRTWVLDDVHA
jgi:hypothetical protein